MIAPQGEQPPLPNLPQEPGDRTLEDFVSEEPTPRRTPLYDTHARHGARFVPFAGWRMPVRYDSIIREAEAVRTNAGLFDVSHMGRVEFEGPGAASLLDSVLSVNVRAMRPGRAHYNLICNPDGGIIDDCIVYRLAEQSFLLIPNASNTDAVLDWIESRRQDHEDTAITNVTADIAMIACQGPRARDMVAQLATSDISRIRPFRARTTTVNGVEAFLARTGYTGEDGFEIMLPSESAPAMWESLMELGAAACGLGARDVLRLEAGLLLHGNDMDTSINPYEAGLDRFVDPDRAGYAAGDALRAIRDEGVSRKIAAFRMTERGIARPGYSIMDGEDRIGAVTSGGPSPTLDTNIGLGYVPIAYSEPGTRIAIEIRGRPVEAEITTLPFYRRSSSA